MGARENMMAAETQEELRAQEIRRVIANQMAVEEVVNQARAQIAEAIKTLEDIIFVEPFVARPIHEYGRDVKELQKILRPLREARLDLEYFKARWGITCQAKM